MNQLRQRLIGAFGALGLLCLLLAVVPAELSLTAPPGTLARMLDNLAPQFLAAALGFALLVVLAGAWRSGLVTVAVTIAAAGFFTMQHLQRSLPLEPGANPALKVLFFNALSENTANAGRIADAIIAADPDVVAVAESAAIESVLPRLSEHFPYDLCPAVRCSETVLSKKPFEPVDQEATQLWRGDYHAISLPVADGRKLTLVALHKTKPWEGGRIYAENLDLQRRLNAISGPLVVMGDFNAAPWSQGSRRLIDATGIRAPRVPVATWPVEAGKLGVPIDNVFVRGGARLVTLAPFGDDLGSNHRGLLADITIDN